MADDVNMDPKPVPTGGEAPPASGGLDPPPPPEAAVIDPAGTAEEPTAELR